MRGAMTVDVLAVEGQIVATQMRLSALLRQADACLASVERRQRVARGLKAAATRRARLLAVHL